MLLSVRSLLGILSFSLILVFSGCGGGGGSDGNVVDDPSGNSPDPVKVIISVTADAGEDQSVRTMSSVILDAGGSKDDANTSDDLECFWEIVSAPADSSATLSGETSISPRLIVDVDGRYEVGLMVTYGDDTATDSIVITATTENIAPNADAGEDQYVSKGTNVTLDGSASSDPNSDRLDYHWTLTSIPNGSSASLSDVTSVTPSFTADRDDTYLVGLMIDDGNLDSTVDTIR